MTLEINEINVQITVAAHPVGATAQPLPSSDIVISEDEMDKLLHRCLKHVLFHLHLRDRR